jgi:hypothetical protein
MSDTKGNRLLTLNKELLASEGYNVVSRLYKFHQSLKIFLANYNDLEDAVNRHVGNSRLFDIRDTEKRKAASDEMFEALRHLHNTVAAALSLVDHTRNFYNEFYQERNLIPDYQEQIRLRFAVDGLSQFVKCLRKFCQHYRIPLASSTLWIDNEQGRHTRSINLLKSDLTEFSGWSAEAKEYIKGLPDRIDLLSVMKAYRDHVIGFYEWFDRQLNEVHRSDLEHYDRLMTEIEHIQSQDPLYRDYRPPPR